MDFKCILDSEEGKINGINSNTLFFGSGRDKAYDEQCEESAHQSAGVISGDSSVGRESWSSIVYIKRQKYCTDRIWALLTEKAKANLRAVGQDSGTIKYDGEVRK